MAMVISVALVISLVAIAAADSPTTTTVTWNGGGALVTATVDSGVSNAGFTTSGDVMSGSFTAVDSNNNPYSYGVDSFSASLNANVTNGYIDTVMARVSSYVPMYGVGGQVDTAFVGVTGGTASMAFRSTTNYASLVDATYTYQLSGGHNIVANGTSYGINRNISDGRGDAAGFAATGSGSATFDCMSSEASGLGNLSFGRGAGCYTDANFNATGSGSLNVGGIGNNSITFNGMGATATGTGANLSFVANWSSSISLADYSLTIH